MKYSLGNTDKLYSEESDEGKEATVISVFIEAQAGSRDKGVYDEASFQRTGTRTALLPYPYPYGFIPGTAGGDEGECLDCYIISSRALQAGKAYAAEPFALLEMLEDGGVDHKLLARLPDESEPPPAALPALRDELEAFILGIFKAYPEVQVRIGALLPKAEAQRLAEERRLAGMSTERG